MENQNRVIKVCPDPQCEAVWHNMPKKETHCKNCGGWVIAISLDQYWKKFSEVWFQYDFDTEEISRLTKNDPQLTFSFND